MSGWRHGQQDEWAFKSRTYRGQLDGINEGAATATIKWDGGPPLPDVTLPMAVNMRGSGGFASSWRRYMPQDHAFCDFTFDTLGNPRIQSYNPADYAMCTKLAADGKLGAWRPLRKGEFDDRSSGGARVYGSQEGRLELESGTVALTLNKERREATLKGLVYTELEASGTSLVVGELRRVPPSVPSPTNPLGFAALPVAVALSPSFPAGAPADAVSPCAREWRLQLGNRIAPVVPFGTLVGYRGIYEELAGDLRADDLTGAPLLSSTMGFLRYRKRILDITADPIVPALQDELFKVEVDHLGNVEATFSPKAILGGLTLRGRGPTPGAPALAPLNVSFGAVDVSAATTMSLMSTLSTVVGSTGVTLLGGLSATEPAVHGSQLLAVLQAISMALKTVPAPMAGAAVSTAIDAALASPAGLALLSTKVLVE